MNKFSLLCLCAALALSACGGEKADTAAAPNADSQSTAATPPASEGDAALNKEMDADLAQMKTQLPMKIGNIMELTSVDRKGTTIEYVYKFMQDGVSKATFNVEQGKKTGAQQLCTNPATKRFVDAGYIFNFKYEFKDGSDIEVPLQASDCAA